MFFEHTSDALLGSIRLPPSWRDLARAYLRQHLEAASRDGLVLSLEELVARVGDPGLVGEPLLAEPRRVRELAQKLRLLTVGTQGLLFTRGRPLSVEALLAPLQPGRTPVNVLWLNRLADVDSKQRFIAFVLSHLYAWMLRHPTERPQLLLYFDEVGPYVPPSREPPSKKVLKQLFQEGRKYGLGGVFCTQNLTDVDYKVLNQAQLLAAGRVRSMQDRTRMQRVLQGLPGVDAEDSAAELARAADGEFLLLGASPDGAPRWSRTRELLTRHGPPWGVDEIRAHTGEKQRRLWAEM
jgi:hypothetical protein